MFPLLPALLGFGGSVVASALSAKSASDQMSFQERMSSTSHQREVEDLKKAGLNPILSAKLGGASSPPGAMVHYENPAKNLTSDYVTAKRLKEVEMKNSAADIALKNAQTDKSMSDILVNRAMEKKILEDARTSISQRELNNAIAAKEGAFVENLISQTALNTAKGRTEAINYILQLARVAESKASTARSRAEAARIGLEARRILAELPRVENLSAIEKTELGKKLTKWERILSVIGKVVGVADQGTSLFGGR